MTITLTERRTVVRALPRAMAAELAERFPHAVEVTPTFDRRRYKLTARGYVGWVRVGETTVTFRPKRPWNEVRCLFTPERAATARERGSDHAFPDSRGLSELLDLLAHRLASLMLARASAGLLRGYVERELTDTHLRGRIDFPSQLRQSFRQPTLFDQIADEWTPDIPWNRLPKAVAVRLQAEPGLSGNARNALSLAVAAFAEVSDAPMSVNDRIGMVWDARTAPYRELIDWCDLIGTENVLVSLERGFEAYATRLFVDALGDAVRVQTSVLLGLPRPGGERDHGTLPSGSRQTIELVPDLTVFTGDSPLSVWDVKWKKPEPTSSDIHQALAYAAALGIPTCGLVYPGRQWRTDTLRASSGVALHLLKLPLTDDPMRWQRLCRRIVNLP